MELHDNLAIVIILAIGFLYSSALGYLALRLHLSPIIGYLIAGYLIGPFSPGFVADLKTAEQLAEIGVILMMFSVGLHFHWRDLMRVQSIAIPGALGQTCCATLTSSLVLYLLGWPWHATLIIGIAISVASTIVLVRILFDHDLLHTREGHIAVGWLIVEDLITVVALLLLPLLAENSLGMATWQHGLVVTAWTLFKVSLLTVLMLSVGRWAMTLCLSYVSNTKSDELFILTLLALIFGIATGSAALFGTSIALGAFIAGMAVASTPLHHQALTKAVPLKDVFGVIFFLSAGMLFNPLAIAAHWGTFLAILAIILILKPLAALIITLVLRHPWKTAITVAVGLAQIGEFSFILAEEAMRLNVLPDDAFDLLVAAAIISIAINPIAFRAFGLHGKHATKISTHEPL